MPDDRFGFLDTGVPKALTPPAGYESVHVAGMSWAIQGASLETTSWVSPAQWNHIIGQFRGLATIAGIDVSDVPDTSPLLLREVLVRGIAASIAANASVIDISAAIDALRGDAPADLDTLEKLAAAIGDDDDFVGTMTTALAAKAAAATAARLDVEGQAATGGVNVTSKDRGTGASTVTIDVSARACQHILNNGAFAIQPGTANGATLLDITNGASAGAITLTGFTKTEGAAALTTTDGHKFRLSISVGHAGSLCQVKALQ